MIIQCENCKTEFNLDESMIKEGGSKVRCSVCKEIFVAYPPSRAPVDDDFPSSEEPSDSGEEDAPETSGSAKVGDAFDRDDFLGDLDGLEDVLYEATEDISKAKDVPDESEKSLLKKTSEGEQQMAERPKPDFPSMEELGLHLDLEEEEPSEKAPLKDEEMEPLADADAGKKKSSKVILFSLILALLLLCAAAAFFYLKPGLIPKSLSLGPEKKQEQTDPGIRLLMFSSVSGGFTETESGGRFFVIKGVVTNKYPEPRSFILIKGSILDDQGKVVQSHTSYAGNSFTEEELRTLPYSEISKAMKNRDGMARKNFNVPSNATIPFMVVFENLEGALSEFTVEAVSSSPGA